MYSEKKKQDLHLSDATHFFFFYSSVKYSISEGKENEAPFIAHMCETGISNCRKENNQISFRNTDRLVSGKSVADKQINRQILSRFKHGARKC